jgi:hypothetical protein
MGPHPDLVTLISIDIKLHGGNTTTINITENPTPGIQPITFYDIRSQIQNSLSKCFQPPTADLKAKGRKEK